MTKASDTLSAEQARELALLEQAAAEQAPAPGSPEALEAEKQAAALAPPTQENQLAAQMLLKVLKPVAEMLAPVCKGADMAAWTALEEPIAGLLDHYAVDLGDMMSNPWARLGMAAIPLGMHISGKLMEQVEQTKAPEQLAQVENVTAPEHISQVEPLQEMHGHAN
jgi:hypothetical protein